MCQCDDALLSSFPISKYCISDTMATMKLSLRKRRKKKRDFSVQERWQTDSPSLPVLPVRQWWCQLWQNVSDYELCVVLWLKSTLGHDQRQTYYSKSGLKIFWENVLVGQIRFTLQLFLGNITFPRLKLCPYSGWNSSLSSAWWWWGKPAVPCHCGRFSGGQ